MDNNLPDFYMTSSENYSLKELRKCYRIRRFKAKHRDDYLLIRIDPPVDSQINSTGVSKNSELIIATRHKGLTLFPIVEWPVAVYVVRVLIQDPEERDVLRDSELELIGWAEIYASIESIQPDEFDNI